MRAEATAAARRELEAQSKGVEKGREEIRVLQDRLALAQQDNTKQAHLLAGQAADLDQRAAKISKQQVGLTHAPHASPRPKRVDEHSHNLLFKLMLTADIKTADLVGYCPSVEQTPLLFVSAWDGKG